MAAADACWTPGERGNADDPDLVASVGQEIRLRAKRRHANNSAHDDFDEQWQLVVGTLRAALTSHVHRQDETKPPETRGGFFIGCKGNRALKTPNMIRDRGLLRRSRDRRGMPW